MCGSSSWFIPVGLALQSMHQSSQLQHLVQMCGSSSWFIPFGLSLPFAWRLLQCLRVYMDTGNRAQLLNALKYALPAL